ncbi:MAG TPA: HlyD family secretion protein [Stellaceae bacterium]|nr:HlyD family secretion protein [Stellaceae bacterium]
MPADGGHIDLQPRSRTDAVEVEARSPAGRAEDLRRAAEERRSERRRRRIRWLLYLLLPILLVVGAYFYVTGGQYMTSDDAYVEANMVAVSTDVSGLVQKIDVHDNQRVVAGQPLFNLDPAPFRYALDRARAQLANVRDQIAALKANYLNLQAQIAQAQARITYAQRQLARQSALAKQQFTPQMQLEQAQLNLQTAEQTLASLKAQQDAIVANLDGKPNIPVEQHPLYRQALAQVDEAARQLRNTVVRAPYAGIVTRVPSLQPGMYLPASTPAFSIVADRSPWVEVQAKETALTYVRPGQPATITVDTYPGLSWHGTVASIGPASASQFSLLPAENTSGNWVKVVQRIPLRIRLNAGADQDKPPLRAGMSVEVSVYTGHQNGLPHFLTALFGSNGKSGTETG